MAWYEDQLREIEQEEARLIAAKQRFLQDHPSQRDKLYQLVADYNQKIEESLPRRQVLEEKVFQEIYKRDYEPWVRKREELQKMQERASFLQKEVEFGVLGRDLGRTDQIQYACGSELGNQVEIRRLSPMIYALQSEIQKHFRYRRPLPKDMAEIRKEVWPEIVSGFKSRMIQYFDGAEELHAQIVSQIKLVNQNPDRDLAGCCNCGEKGTYYTPDYRWDLIQLRIYTPDHSDQDQMGDRMYTCRGRY